MILTALALSVVTATGAAVFAALAWYGAAVAMLAATQLLTVAAVLAYVRRHSIALRALSETVEQERNAAWKRDQNVRAMLVSSAEASTLLTTRTDEIAENLPVWIDDVRGSVRDVRARVDRSTGRIRTQLGRDLNALLTLHLEYARGADLAGYSSWSATPETLLMIASAVRELPDDSTVVEFGGGVSTAWIALANRRRQTPVHVVSLEHDEAWARETRAILERIGAPEVDLRVAPLRALDLPGWSGMWYDPESLRGLENIGLAFVDGPPGGTAPLARYPAVPLIRDRLSDGGFVVLDDLDRGEEREIRDRWITEFHLTEHRATDRAVMLRADET